MILYINGQPVTTLSVQHKTGGKTIAVDDSEQFVICLDDLEDRSKTDAILDEAATVHGFEGKNGMYWARLIPADSAWGVHGDGAGTWYRTLISRSEAIDLAFHLAYGTGASGLA